jgi:hypothetical protein
MIETVCAEIGHVFEDAQCQQLASGMRQTQAETLRKRRALSRYPRAVKGFVSDPSGVHAGFLDLLGRDLGGPSHALSRDGRKNTRLKSTRHGLLLYPGREAVGQALDQFGEWDEECVAVFRLFLDDPDRGDTVVDAGAHVGTYTVVFAAAVGPKGQVCASHSLSRWAEGAGPHRFCPLRAAARCLPTCSGRRARMRPRPVPQLVPCPHRVRLPPSIH